MRLQSKKSNQPVLPPLITCIFIFSLIYWLYLGLTTRMDIACDSIGYEALGQLIQKQGWVAYFTTGPNREPIYPLLVALSMHIGLCTGLAYAKIMAIFGIFIMFLTQVLTYKVLRLFNIRNGVSALVLSYLCLSPALNNAAFSLYSEIAAFPFILSMVLTSYYAWEAIKRNENLKSFVFGALLGSSLTAATLIKAVFECVTPAYLIIFFTSIFLTEKKYKNKKITTLLLCWVAAVSFYYAPVTGYKWLNLHYNGNFAITDRGSFALYGSTARRMEPLDLKRFAEALAFAPGEGVCDSLFGPKECDFWSFRKSDELGLAKQDELLGQHLSLKKTNAALVTLSAQKALHNPFQYVLLTIVEGSKMFFWESTQIGFVSYPSWLQRIYDIKIFNNGLRLLTSLVTLAAIVSLWLGILSPRKSPVGFLMGTLIFLYILFFSFFFILTRYALPIAPLYLIAIGLWIDQNVSPKKIK